MRLLEKKSSLIRRTARCIVLKPETLKSNMAAKCQERQKFIVKDDIQIKWTLSKSMAETPNLKREEVSNERKHSKRIKKLCDTAILQTCSIQRWKKPTANVVLNLLSPSFLSYLPFLFLVPEYFVCQRRRWLRNWKLYSPCLTGWMVPSNTEMPS